MAAFKNLKDVCQNFEQELALISSSLFSAKLEERFEDVVSKKTRDLALFTAKSRLLCAKPLSLLPQVASANQDEDTILINYEETVTHKLIERQVVKSATQGHAVKNLVTAPNDTLGPELLKRKRKILLILQQFSAQESVLLSIRSLIKEKEDALADIRERWHAELGCLRDIKEQATGKDAINTSGPYYRKLQLICGRSEQMRWLVPHMATARTRGGYDWLSDPHHRMQAVKAARKPCGVDSFVDYSLEDIDNMSSSE